MTCKRLRRLRGADLLGQIPINLPNVGSEVALLGQWVWPHLEVHHLRSLDVYKRQLEMRQLARDVPAALGHLRTSGLVPCPRAVSLSLIHICVLA